MREHRYFFDMPHSPARIWALMQECAMCFSVTPGHDRWEEYDPMVLEDEILDPGDEVGNGLVRLLLFKMPFGRRATARERLSDVDPGRSYVFHMGVQTGKVTLEPRGPNQTRLHFEERFDMTRAPMKWFEGPIYRYINRKNEESMRGFSRWLNDHPAFRSDLIDAEEAAAVGAGA